MLHETLSATADVSVIGTIRTKMMEIETWLTWSLRSQITCWLFRMIMNTIVKKTSKEHIKKRTIHTRALHTNLTKVNKNKKCQQKPRPRHTRTVLQMKIHRNTHTFRFHTTDTHTHTHRHTHTHTHARKKQTHTHTHTHSHTHTHHTQHEQKPNQNKMQATIATAPPMQLPPHAQRRRSTNLFCATTTRGALSVWPTGSQGLASSRQLLRCRA